MKTKQILLLTVTLLLVSTGVQGQSAPWKLYTIGGEDFSVALPAIPVLDKTYEELDNGKKRRRIYTMGTYADGVVYVITVVENPDSRQSLESFLKLRTFRDSSITDANLNGFPGKNVTYADVMRQLFATKNRLYEFHAMGAPLDDPRMTTFFSSLSLRKKTDSIEVVDGPFLPDKLPAEVEPAPAAEFNTVFSSKDVDKRVRLGMKPAPSYTEEARANALTGTVVLKCILASNGSITNIRTVSGLPYGLTEKAIAAARKIKFIPAIKDGKFVSIWMQLEYNFNLY